MVSLFPPLSDGLSIENDNLDNTLIKNVLMKESRKSYSEKGIQKKNPVRSNAIRAEEHRSWSTIEGIRLECGLNHDQRVAHCLSVQHRAVESRLIKTGTEHLKECY